MNLRFNPSGCAAIAVCTVTHDILANLFKY